MIFYTNRFIPKQHHACTRGPIIFIRSEFKGDKGLLKYELVHRKQWLRTFCLHSLLYLFADDYRLKAEIEAFREQSKHYPEDRLSRFADLLASNYGLVITVEEALTLLRKE